MTAFLDAFWPNFAATVLGVAIGAPIALFLNRHILDYQRRLETKDKVQRLGHAIDVLIGALKYNIEILDNMRELSLSGRVMRNPDLRVTTWDAVGSMLSDGSNDPELLQLLSHHWLRLHRLEKLNEEMFAREFAKSLPAIADQELALGFWQELHDGALNLSAHASEAAGRLQLLRSRPRTGVVP